ncbi:MAG: ATP-binding protein [Armatimonadota bacterium]
MDLTKRASAEELADARKTLLDNVVATALLEAMPDLALVLNPERQIVAVNGRVLDAVGISNPEFVVGRRPGELFLCIQAANAPDGCGTGEGCDVCGALNSILECLDTKDVAVKECRMTTSGTGDGGALELEVQSTYFTLSSGIYVIVALRDVSAEKRRGVLERTFFHDVLNITTGLYSLSELLSIEDDPAAEEEYKRELRLMVQQVNDEILAQRQLLAAEKGELELRLGEVHADETLGYVADLYRSHSVSRGREIVVNSCAESTLWTDGVLLRRVLGNLLKNALEATPDGGTVTISAREWGDNVSFDVHNPTVIPADVQKQMFQRSFSTKGGGGRGIGTHSVKLLTERYLLGRVSFASNDAIGTVFMVTLPKSLPGNPGPGIG